MCRIARLLAILCFLFVSGWYTLGLVHVWVLCMADAGLFAGVCIFGLLLICK